ncbi:Putative protein in type-1 retrotransposable element R1DM [Araneus ventricosus]|uniref:Reverse transcriptase domain-containing protein n=1 Tax=Araneus ventricosus TaxID=182803 RepID=A0A4Y2HIL5_ARAVE|nr:Putative protein in type-1 retrotransposable element R1DM [Araneus ventricosus]
MITLALSLDISNAFNSVIWDDLINCLEEDGISVYLIDVIKDFLSNRIIYDDINNTEFNYSKGVPQGSCLSPVLWLLIADRLLRQMDEQENIMYTMFADDILIMSSGTVSYKFTESLVPPIKVVESWANKYKLKINPTKSKFIMFPYKKDITHVPRLKMNDIVIKQSRTLKYLGLLFDERLTWRPHLEGVREKVNYLQNKLYRFSRATWGVKPQVLKEIYKVAIEKYILYGVEIWFNKTVKISQKLIQIQRVALVQIAKTYKTVSLEALQVLTGLVPLDLVADKEVTKFNLFNRGIPINIKDKEYSFQDFDLVNKLGLLPWEKGGISWSMDSDPNGRFKKIFTDESKLNGRVGSGVVCLSEDIDIIWKLEIRLNDEASVFIAEAVAIQMAVEKVGPTKEKIVIFFGFQIRIDGSGV